MDYNFKTADQNSKDAVYGFVRRIANSKEMISTPELIKTLCLGYYFDSNVLKIGSIIGFKLDCTQTNSNTKTHNTITIGIISDNININNCDIRDIHNDKLYKNVSWRRIYVLYSLSDDKELCKKGDQCYAIWQLQIEHTYTTQYYKAIFMHKDLIKNQIQLKYTYGTNGNTFTLPTYVTIYDFKYPTLVKPIIAAYSEAYRKLRVRLSSSISESGDKDEKESQNKSRKRKLSPNNNHHILAPKLKKPKLNTNRNIIPTEICVSGYGKDKETYSKFESYAKKLGIPLNKKWSIASTQILISKYDAFNGKPFVSFKVLASILCGIPVVKQGYLQDSYEQNKVLDYNNYICNYRRIDNSNGIFKGLKILLKKYSTNMPSDRLKTLLTLGKATILERFETDINNKDIKEKENRIMICSYDIEWREAKQFSEEYNCNVISESWIIKCIYDDEINQINDGRKPVVDRYKLEPINERVDFEEFDKTINTEDDSN